VNDLEVSSYPLWVVKNVFKEEEEVEEVVEELTKLKREEQLLANMLNGLGFVEDNRVRFAGKILSRCE
jgi:predicted DNA-binding protein with PD1-like motif